MTALSSAENLSGFGLGSIFHTAAHGREPFAEYIPKGKAEQSAIFEAADRALRQEILALAPEPVWLLSAAMPLAAHLPQPAEIAVATVNAAVLNALPIDRQLTIGFRKAYNGTGLDRLTTWLLRGRISEAQSESLLADAVEDALIGVYFGMSEGLAGRPIEIREKDFPILQAAIAERLPRLSVTKRREFAKRLAFDLRESLVGGGTLLIDGAAVSLSNGGIYISPHRSDAQSESEKVAQTTYRLAA